MCVCVCGLSPLSPLVNYCLVGIWRIKPNPFQQDNDPMRDLECDPLRDIGVAAMRGGAHVLSITQGIQGDHHPPTEKVTPTTLFPLHESMVYGLDWISPFTLATCSFYDNALYVWWGATHENNHTNSSNNHDPPNIEDETKTPPP